MTGAAAISEANREALGRLPYLFRYATARQVLNERRLRELLEGGLLVRVERGVYRKAVDSDADDLVVVSAKAPRATLCLRSALGRHGLIDDIPTSYDLALPRGTWAPAVGAPVTWHHFDARTFDVGRQELQIGPDHRIGLYEPERTIVDAYRMRGLEGPELGTEALRRWLRAGGQASVLLRTAQQFPAALPSLRAALEVLL